MSTEDRIRVWNEDTGEMLKPATIQEMLRDVNNIALIHGEHLPQDSDPYGHLVFMRNTGIYDEGGKEIFAEDLVTHSTEPWVYRVVQKRGCWWAMSLCQDMAQAWLLNNIIHPTIVGNVFENKDIVLKGEIIDE